MLKQTRIVLAFPTNQRRIGPVKREIRFGKEDIFAWIDDGHEEVEQGIGARHGHAHIVLVHARLVG